MRPGSKQPARRCDYTHAEVCAFLVSHLLGSGWDVAVASLRFERFEADVVALTSREGAGFFGAAFEVKVGESSLSDASKKNQWGAYEQRFPSFALAAVASPNLYDGGDEGAESWLSRHRIPESWGMMSMRTRHKMLPHKILATPNFEIAKPAENPGWLSASDYYRILAHIAKAQSRSLAYRGVHAARLGRSGIVKSFGCEH